MINTVITVVITTAINTVNAIKSDVII